METLLPRHGRDDRRTDGKPSNKSLKSIRELEKQIILRRLALMSGNRTKTAESLGLSVRTLRAKLLKYKEESKA